MTEIMERFVLLLSEVRRQFEAGDDVSVVMNNMHATIRRFSRSEPDAQRLEDLLFQAMEDLRSR